MIQHRSQLVDLRVLLLHLAAEVLEVLLQTEIALLHHFKLTLRKPCNDLLLFVISAGLFPLRAAFLPPIGSVLALERR